MKASRLIAILASHIEDCEGGDFDVFVSTAKDERASPMVLHSEPAGRCWLYPRIKQIVIGTTGVIRSGEHGE
jgi:hypothetical protein